jgi:hypothetical protein
MDVIIVSKTHMANGVCVGGVLGNGRFVRLLNTQGYNQDFDTPFKVGEVYTIIFSDRHNLTPPHIEDILVSQANYKFSFPSHESMVAYLTEKLYVKIWKGSTEVLFDGKLQWTSAGSGYISGCESLPENSVGFWLPDKDLTKKEFQGKVRYGYPIKWRNIAFVGFQDPVEKIPANTLVRVSLARWWAPNEEDEKRCYLQISGWYCLP